MDHRNTLGRDLRLRGAGHFAVGIVAEHGVDDDLARLFDGEELMPGGMLGTEMRSRDAFLAQVVVRAIEALVTDAGDLRFTYVAKDVLVN